MYGMCGWSECALYTCIMWRTQQAFSDKQAFRKIECWSGENFRSYDMLTQMNYNALLFGARRVWCTDDGEWNGARGAHRRNVCADDDDDDGDYFII